MLFVLRDWHRLILIIHQSFQFFPSSHLLQVTRLQNSPWALWLTDPGQGSSVPRGRFRSDPVTVQSSFHCCCSLPFRCNLCSCNPWKTEKAKMCFTIEFQLVWTAWQSVEIPTKVLCTFEVKPAGKASIKHCLGKEFLVPWCVTRLNQCELCFLSTAFSF